MQHKVMDASPDTRRTDTSAPIQTGATPGGVSLGVCYVEGSPPRWWVYCVARFGRHQGRRMSLAELPGREEALVVFRHYESGFFRIITED